MDEERLFIGLLSILRTLITLYEAYKVLQKRKRPLNLTHDTLGFHATCAQRALEIDEEDLMKGIHMDVENYKGLLALLKERLTKYSNRKPIDANIRLSLTLFYLAQGCSFRFLAMAYKLGESTVRKIIYDTCDAIWKELRPIYMAEPNLEEWKQHARDFHVSTGMPNCIGAIDGKHVKLVCPTKSGSVFVSYKKNFSILLFAACDSNYSFTFVDVVTYGSQNEEALFSSSAFGRRVFANTLEVPEDKNLPGTTIRFPHFFVADNAFPLKENLMRPYPGHHLPDDKAKFNKCLLRVRERIENTFGILVNRWQILHNTTQSSPRKADKIVLATTVLHNFLMFHKDESYFTRDVVDCVENDVHIRGTWRNNTESLLSHSQIINDIQPLQTQAQRRNNRDRSSSIAFGLRDTLKNYLQNI